MDYSSVSSLYLHVPFCRHLCNYCDFYKRKLEDSKDQIDEYNQLLLTQVNTLNKFLKTESLNVLPLETLYFGGGTPSLWGEKGIEFCHNYLLKFFPLSKNCEWTLEVDPATTSYEQLKRWKDLGVTRFSLGLQAYQDDYLRLMDRIHTVKDIDQLCQWIQALDVAFSVDFMIGLPHLSQKREIIKELNGFLKFKPVHISVYILDVRKNYPFYKQLPDGSAVETEYLEVNNYLSTKGFEQYEVSSYARPGFRSKHNSKYWKLESVLALGPTATGFIRLTSQNAVRFKWKVISEGAQWESLDNTSLELEGLYMSLRSYLGWKYPVENRPMVDLVNCWVNERKIAYFQDDRVVLKPKGRVVLDGLMSEVFARQKE